MALEAESQGYTHYRTQVLFVVINPNYTGGKNSWKTQGAICICHEDKAQIWPFEEHPRCNTWILRQTK